VSGVPGEGERRGSAAGTRQGSWAGPAVPRSQQNASPAIIPKRPATAVGEAHKHGLPAVGLAPTLGSRRIASFRRKAYRMIMPDLARIWTRDQVLALPVEGAHRSRA